MHHLVLAKVSATLAKRQQTLLDVIMLEKFKLTVVLQITVSNEHNKLVPQFIGNNFLSVSIQVDVQLKSIRGKNTRLRRYSVTNRGNISPQKSDNIVLNMVIS